jgi:long-subunit fatty acid transport protein
MIMSVNNAPRYGSAGRIVGKSWCTELTTSADTSVSIPDLDPSWLARGLRYVVKPDVLIAVVSESTHWKRNVVNSEITTGKAQIRDDGWCLLRLRRARR